MSCENGCGALAERVGRGAIVMRAGRNCWHLLAADDHYQEFVRSDQYTAGHAPTAASITPWPTPWATFAAKVATMPRPSNPRASAGTRMPRRTESNTTTELA
jgi:hypothetical protein